MADHKKELLLIGGSPKLGGDIYKYMAETAEPEGEIGYIGFASTDDAIMAQKKPLIKEEFGKYGIKVRFIESEEDCYGLGIHRNFVPYCLGADPEYRPGAS